MSLAAIAPISTDQAIQHIVPFPRFPGDQWIADLNLKAVPSSNRSGNVVTMALLSATTGGYDRALAGESIVGVAGVVCGADGGPWHKKWLDVDEAGFITFYPLTVGGEQGVMLEDATAQADTIDQYAADNSGYPVFVDIINSTSTDKGLDESPKFVMSNPIPVDKLDSSTATTAGQIKVLGLYGLAGNIAAPYAYICTVANT